jgi:predicted RNase H-like nuclease (RuvC/YqgF family)
MSFEACKDLAKNPRIPPNIAVQALKSQHSKIPLSDCPFSVKDVEGPSTSSSSGHMVLHSDNVERLSQETQEMRMNIQRMQCRVMELENACREMKGRISKVVRHDVNVMSSTPPYNYSRSPFPRLC